MGNKIELKTVQELLGMKFFIPSYQRGYRWTKSQITALLNDIYEFDKSIDGDFYCLQPLVVKYDEINGWRVIDGQQRLTTIYLILKVLGNDNLFELKYERDSYIKNLEEIDGVCSDNIEIYHLTTAREIIKEWLKNKKLDVELKKKLEEKLLNQTKFIFYNVGALSDDAEHDLFNNLNSGKIALTNAELIKALFLNKVGNEDVAHREVEQRLLADEFDQIERTLRNDDFWYFLAGNAEKPSSCIDLLFDLMFEADSNVNKNKYPEYEKFRTFFYFNDKINNGGRTETYSKSKVLWEDVRYIFHVMEGWFNDSTIYNLVGYHRAVNAKSLAGIYKKFIESQSKLEFKNWLVKECEEYIDYPDGFMNLRYDTNKSAVSKLLLLFNIATLLKKPQQEKRKKFKQQNQQEQQERVKFSFASFLTHKWDVEHISPQNPQNKDLQLADNELMSIGNLTLLTDHVNRGISNGNYEEKRNDIQKYYRQGCYIPLCSMNVFMKFYSEKPTQFLSWDENDRKDYTQEIKNTIIDFFESKTEQL